MTHSEETTPNDAWNIQRLLDWSTNYLKKIGIQWPHLEAEILIAHILKLKRIELYLKPGQTVTHEELSTYKALLLRRKNQEPLAHLTGNFPFMGLDFKVTPAVLIPRPETEKMVELILAELQSKQSAEPQRTFCALEIGTGSGCIAVSLAKFVPGLQITTVEIDQAAHEIAKENSHRHQTHNQVNLVLGDARRFPAENRFDYLVSNPPYIPTDEIAKLDQSVKNFEPHHALDGGIDGLEFIRLIAQHSTSWLNPGGRIWVEIGHNQAETAELIFKAAGLEKIKTLLDQNDIPRFLTASRIQNEK